jgi:hypothetical protein
MPETIQLCVKLAKNSYFGHFFFFPQVAHLKYQGNAVWWRKKLLLPK